MDVVALAVRKTGAVPHALWHFGLLHLQPVLGAHEVLLILVRQQVRSSHSRPLPLTQLPLLEERRLLLDQLHTRELSLFLHRGELHTVDDGLRLQRLDRDSSIFFQNVFEGFGQLDFPGTVVANDVVRELKPHAVAQVDVGVSYGFLGYYVVHVLDFGPHRVVLVVQIDRLLLQYLDLII